MRRRLGRYDTTLARTRAAVLGLLLLLPSFVSNRVWIQRKEIADTGSSSLKADWVLRRMRVRILLAEDFRSLALRNTHWGEEVSVRVTGARIQLLGENGRQLHAPGSGFRVEPWPEDALIVAGSPYRGNTEFFVNPLGVTVAVNDVALEDYLKGVVPRELNPRQFPQIEALKAQSVAARTFTLAGLGSRGRHGYDLFADVRSQVYGGLQDEQPASDRAVDETLGLYAVFGGRPIVAFFSSTCGGVTANYAEVFQGPEIAYLKGAIRCPDGTGRYATWSESREVSHVQETLDRYAGVGRLRQIQIRRRDSTGRVAEMLFSGDAGDQILRGLQARYALGLKSHFITALKLRKDPRGYITHIEVDGKGFGHGVGMCQVGAAEMARSGHSFREILTHYYPGINIETLEAVRHRRL